MTEPQNPDCLVLKFEEKDIINNEIDTTVYIFGFL
jgi:hypothetical protein